MMWNTFEKRKFPRIQKECGISVAAPDGNEVFHSVTENIGLGGLSTNLPKPLDPFTKVRIKLILKPNEEPFECDARVAWSIKHRDFDPKLVHFDVGFEFLDLPESERSRLGHFLSESASGL
jgi:hypothetical protein